jgi:hypothetical protein
MQVHHGPYAHIPIQMSWAMRDGQLFLESGVRGQRLEGFTLVDTFEWLIERQPRGTGPPELPLEPNVWYRMLLSVTLGSNVNAQGCPIYTATDLGEVRVWLMDNETGLYDELVPPLHAPIGSLTDKDGVFQSRSACEFQWKTGIYAIGEYPITMYLDNVRYGKRWNDITKNRLVGYHKTVLSLPLDFNVNDASRARNGGVQGEVHTDYNNDATVVGTSTWSAPGVGGSAAAFRFTGTNHLNVPMDVVDFDFGNYATSSVCGAMSTPVPDERWHWRSIGSERRCCTTTRALPPLGRARRAPLAGNLRR